MKTSSRWIQIRDFDGIRHRLRPWSIIALSGADHAGDTTAITIQGGRVIIVAEPLDVVAAAVEKHEAVGGRGHADLEH